MFANNFSGRRFHSQYYFQDLQPASKMPPSAEQIDLHMQQLRQCAPTSAPYGGDYRAITIPYTPTQYPVQTPLSPVSNSTGYDYPQNSSTTAMTTTSAPVQSLLSAPMQMSRSFTDFHDYDTPYCQSPNTPISCYHDPFEHYEDIQSVYSDTPSSMVSEGFGGFPEFFGQNLYPVKSSDSQRSSRPSIGSDAGSTQSYKFQNITQCQTTEVDALMQALEEPSEAPCSETAQSVGTTGKIRKHQCPLPDCHKAFSQPTHLKIHLRSHTGEKPYCCHIPGCNAAFSQLGNLRTHERRHRGEKPRRRSRAQSDPTNMSNSKQYECILDGCNGKVFSQLGNLKAHMNKFHKDTLARLNTHFTNSTYQDETNMSKEELELRDYFKSLYKNCNKGIKGRGKGRRVAVVV